MQKGNPLRPGVSEKMSRLFSSLLHLHPEETKALKYLG